MDTCSRVGTYYARRVKRSLITRVVISTLNPFFFHSLDAGEDINRTVSAFSQNVIRAVLNTMGHDTMYGDKL